MKNFLVPGVLVAFGAVVVVALQPSTDSARPPSAPRVAAVDPSKTTHAAAPAGPALETRKAPVPVVRNGRQPSVMPASAEPAVDTRPTDARGADARGADAQGADAPPVDGQQTDMQQADTQQVDAQQADLDKKAVQAAAEADGYKRVTVLGKAGNGAWRAKGFRGSTEVLLTVDGTGRVSMD